MDHRTLVQSSTQKTAPPTTHFALNEVALLKQESASMIAVHATINTSWSTTYWADGLIIATPTGSTGYSLSCNGPIVLPNARNLIITPISPHNLAVRPLIVPDSTVISLQVTSRNQKIFDNARWAFAYRQHSYNTHHQEGSFSGLFGQCKSTQ